MHDCINVGSHFLFVHVHSTFHRKMGLKCAGVEGDRACANTINKGLHNKKNGEPMCKCLKC